MFEHAQEEATAEWLHSKFCLNNTPALVDSGATVHVVNNKHLLTDFIPVQDVHVKVGDGKPLKAKGFGYLMLRTATCTYKLSTPYVPKMQHNALSVSGLTEKGLTVVFDKNRACVYEYGVPDSAPILIAKKCKGLYVVDLDESTKRVRVHVEPPSERVHVESPSVCGVCVERVCVCDVSDMPVPPASVCCQIVGNSEGAIPTATELPNPTVHTPACTASTSMATDDCEATIADAKLWHARLGHIAKSTLHYLCEHEAAIGIPSFSDLESVYTHPCAECLAGRFPAASHSTLRH